MRAILERDFLFEGARLRAFVLRTLLAALVAAAVLVSFWIASRQSAVSQDVVGMAVFGTGAFSLLVLLALLTPPLVVGSILEEREGDTLALVLATPVGPRTFAAAKLLSRWGVALLVAFAALPALSFGTLLGGVSGSQLVGLVVTALALSLELAAWSVYLSAVSRRLASAVVLSYVLPLARWIGTGYFLGYLTDHMFLSGHDSGRRLILVVAGTSPIGTVPEVVYPTALTEISGLRGWNPTGIDALLLRQPWWGYLAASILLAACAVAAAGARLASEAEPRESLLARTKAGRRWFRGRPPAGNPVVWKEMRLLNTSASRPLFYGVLALLVLVFFLGLPAMTFEGGLPVILAGMFTLVSLVAAVTGSAAVGQERAKGGFDLLRISLLWPREIVHGKLAGVFTGAGMLLAIPLASALIALGTGSLGLRGLLGVLVVLGALPGAWGIVGMWIGIRAPTAKAAVLRATALFGGFLVGLPLLGVLLGAFDIADDTVVRFLCLGSPPGTAWGVLDFLQQPRDWHRSSDDGAPALIWALGWWLLSAFIVVRFPAILGERMDRDRGPGPP